MTGNTHVICSTAVMCCLSLTMPDLDIGGVTVYPVIGILPCAIGALLPDIDIPQSRLGSKFGLLSKNLKHRGFTHTLVIPVVLLTAMFASRSKAFNLLLVIAVGVLVKMVYGLKKAAIATVAFLACTLIIPETCSSILFGLSVGWLLHIFEDMFNSKGCPALYPISKRRCAFPFAVIKTRHWTETIFKILWLGGCLIWGLLIAGGGSIMDVLYRLVV